MKKYSLFLLLCIISLTGFSNPPPADTIFQVSVRTIDPNSFSFDWHIKKGFFLYKKSIQLTEPSSAELSLGTRVFPASLQKKDAQGHSYDIYRKQLALIIPVLSKVAGEYTLNMNYQGCSDEGFCYPPQQSTITLVFNEKEALTQARLEKTPLLSTKKASSHELEALFSTNNWGFIILSFFGFGLLLAFTPCVLPMIPVLSGIIVGHGSKLSTKKAFLLSLSYVLSMSITYSVIGAVIAFMGNNLQIAMQSPWAIGLFSVMFVLLALSMFNVYELRLPLSLQNKMANITRSQHGGHYLSAAIMGCLSILILSPCVTAPLIGVLGYIAHEGNIGLGILSLFFLGLGMGTPLLLIGTSAGKLLPRAGKWMNEVKAFFGVVLLAVAIYLLERLLPALLTMALWACLLIFSGIYLGALSRAKSRLEKFNQGAGFILIAYGLLILIGASQGHNNPLHPLQSEHINEQMPQSSKVTTLTKTMQLLMDAAKQGKPVVVDFYADWCASCKVISSTVLRDQQVEKALEPFILLTIDLSANDADSHELLNYFNVVAPPAFLFFDSTGKELPALRMMGEISSDELIDHLNNTRSIHE